MVYSYLQLFALYSIYSVATYSYAIKLSACRSVYFAKYAVFTASEPTRRGLSQCLGMTVLMPCSHESTLRACVCVCVCGQC
jgi:hypothetical protein